MPPAAIRRTSSVGESSPSETVEWLWRSTRKRPDLTTPYSVLHSERDLDVRLVFDDATALHARGPVSDVDPADAPNGLRGFEDGGANGVVPARLPEATSSMIFATDMEILPARRFATTVPPRRRAPRTYARS